MPTNVKSLGIDKLSFEERLILVQEIWDSIAIEAPSTFLTEAQRLELVRRIADDDSAPDAVITWEEVKSQTLSRLPKP